MLEDETRIHMYEATINQLVKKYKEVYYVHLQENFGRMLHPDQNHLMERGRYEETIRVHIDNGTIYPEDVEVVKTFFNTAHVLKEFETKDKIQVEYRRKGKEGDWQCCRATICVCDRVNGTPMSGLLMIEAI